MVRKMPSSFSKKIFTKSFVFELVTSVINGTLSAPTLNKVFKALGFTSLPQLNSRACLSILENIVVEEFANSNPASHFTKESKRRKSIGLGPFAISLVEKLTGLDDNKIGQGLELIYALPQLNAYSTIEEMFLKLSKKAAKPGDFPLYLKTMAIPWDDKIFFKQDSRLMSRASLTIISALVERGRAMIAYPQLITEDNIVKELP